MNVRDHPPIKLAGLALLAIIALTLTLVYLQFRGDLSPKTQLTLVSGRAGLVMDPGSKVTFNGVEIGRVATVSSTESNGVSAARITMNEYNAGTVDFTTVATAQVAELNSRLAALTIFSKRLAASVDLITALGGGWSTADLPDAHGVFSGQRRH